MEQTSIIGIILVAANCLVSYNGFKNESFRERYLFEVDKILIAKQFDRLLSSGFLHLNPLHLILNVLVLYSFSASVEFAIGLKGLAIVYFAALLGGNLLALFFHRHHGDYRALGASGAVSGVVFAAIILDPFGKIGFLFIPVEFPSWLMGLLFVLISIYGIKSRVGNIGHEAHLGGAMIGLLTTLFFWPEWAELNGLVLIVLLVPTSVFMLLATTMPEFMLIDHFFAKKVKSVRGERKRDAKRNEGEELDELLKKISVKGIGSLSKKERKRLDELSGKG